jgi:Fanconi anemia group M protein
MPLETLKHIQPRDYQKEIYESCKEKNCLVILPTGIGKTLIALMLAITRQKTFPGSKALFLAPTRPLAQQHLEYFKKNLPELFAEMNLFTGKIDAKKRQELWQVSDIIFSTPQCIGNDIKKGLYDLEEVSLLIEDECHRCVKNYAYTFVAQKYLEQSRNSRVLGLTASPGTEKVTIQQIVKNLGIEKIEIRTRDSIDVKQYLQELDFKTIKIDFPEEINKIRKLIHSIFNRKTEELKHRRLLFHPPTKRFLLECQGNIMRSLNSGNKNMNMMMGASAASQAIKLEHLLELIETQTLASSNEYFKQIFLQAREQQSKAVQHIVKQPEFNQAYILLTELLAKKQEHPKIEEIKNIISNSIKQNPKAKIIIFSQFRFTAQKIAEEINKIPDIKARVFVGQSSKKNSKGEKTGLNQKEQNQMINDFKAGEINVLCSTSIGEEGLDIPEVNTVIFYEPVPSAIRKIQRAGRTARLMKGELIILITLGTRDEAYYYASINKEKKMHKSIKDIKDKIDSENIIENNKELRNTGKSKEQKTLF